MEHAENQSTTHRQSPTTRPTRPERSNQSETDSAAGSQTLSISIPNERTGESRCAFVEAVLIELTHEPVGAVHTPGAVADDTRRELVCVDDVGETFEFRQYSPRHDWTTERMSRAMAREHLLTLVGRPSGRADSAVDTLAVVRAGDLQSRGLEVDR